MNEMLVCRTCYRVRRATLDENDFLCSHCFACCWLLVSMHVDHFASIIYPHNDHVATNHLLRVLRRVKAVNR